MQLVVAMSCINEQYCAAFCQQLGCLIRHMFAVRTEMAVICFLCALYVVDPGFFPA